MSTAKIILNQIKAMDKLAMMAWGAKELIDMGDGLKFKSSGLAGWKGYVYIKYDEGSDLYNVDFFKIRKSEIKYTKQLTGVYVDMLINVIDEVVK